MQQGQEADRALAAMQDVASWAAANQQSFLGRHVTDGNGNPKMPAGGWYGKWSEQDDWERHRLRPSPARRVLEATGVRQERALHLAGPRLVGYWQ